MLALGSAALAAEAAVMEGAANFFQGKSYLKLE